MRHEAERRITHRWAGPYHDRLEICLDGRVLKIDEIEKMLTQSLDLAAQLEAVTDERDALAILLPECQAGNRALLIKLEAAKKDAERLRAAAEEATTLLADMQPNPRTNAARVLIRLDAAMKKEDANAKPE